MNEANKFKLGAFLLIAITLLIVGFLSAGIMQIFAPKYRAMTVLNTSVEGLAIGSPVKYLGMPVGKITGMAMRESDGNIAVYFEIFPSAVEAGDPDGDGPDFDALDVSTIMRNKNMMCFINAAGIMGGSYLELSINDSSQPSTPHLDITPPPDVSYIPSRPSHIGNAIQNISRMLDELEKVNFIQLADKLNETLDNMSGLLNQSELRNTLKSINTICNNLENSISRLQVVLSDSNVAKLNRSIDNLDAGIQEFRSTLNGRALSETLANFDGFLTEARAAIADARIGCRALGDQAGEARLRLEMSLTRLDNMLKQFSTLAENLSADPNQFVRGRQETPVQPE